MTGRSIHEVAEAMIKAAHASPESTPVVTGKPEDLLKAAEQLAVDLRRLADATTPSGRLEKRETLAEKMASLARPLEPEDRKVAEMLHRINALRDDAEAAIQKRASVSEPVQESKGVKILRALASAKEGA